MYSVKTFLSIILFSAVVGFIIYRAYWKNNNIPTEGGALVSSIICQEAECPRYLERVESIQSDIDKNSELQVLKCYQNTSDLREMLLDKKIKATDIIENKHLIPKGVKIPKVNNHQTTNVDPNISRTDTRPVTINESSMPITGYPNFFDNLIDRKAVPTSENWHSYRASGD